MSKEFHLDLTTAQGRYLARKHGFDVPKHQKDRQKKLDKDRERFMSSIMPITETGCWIWMRYINPHKDGYGTFTWDTPHKHGNAHRAAYELFVKIIPDGMCVLHKCDIRSCVNPSHLFLGTHEENALDMIKKGRQYIGKRYSGEENSKAKLTAQDVREIRIKLEQKIMSASAIAREYGVSHTAIRAIKLGRAWQTVI